MSSISDMARNLFKNVKSTQESIQKTSKWIMQNKQDIDVITRVWSELYREREDSLKISLIYVMNDVVQLAKHEKDNTVPMAFHPHVVNAATFASESVKKPIKRCLDVFSERHIYPEHVISEMKSALDGLDATPSGDTDDISDFDVDEFRRRLGHYSDTCTSIDRARMMLDSINFDSAVDDERIKNKSGVIEMENEVNLMIEKLQKFITSVEGQYKRTIKVKQLNAKANKYYGNHIKDISIVYDAYDRFAKGIDASRSVLDTIVKSGILPGQDIPEAPSPTPSEDLIDENDGDDMEIDDDENPTNSNVGSSLIPPKDYVPVVQGKQQVRNHPTSNNSSTSVPDPRKLRNLQKQETSTVQPLPSIPALPPGLAAMMPPPLFNPMMQFNQPPPSFVNYNVPRRSFDSQDDSEPPGVNTIEQNTWRNNDSTKDSPRTPSLELQRMQFSSPPPSQPNVSGFFQPQLRSFPSRDSHNFNSQREDRRDGPRFQKNSHEDGRKRSGEYDRSPKKHRRDGRTSYYD